MSDSGDMELERMIESLRRTPDALNDATPKLTGAVRRFLEQANAAGVTPEGEPYKRTLQGLVPLQNGRKAISVRFDGDNIIARVTGIEAMHSLGEARGEIVRRMLPEADPPPALMRELEDIAERYMREVFE